MDLYITHNNITFADAQAMRIKHPATFYAPSKEDLDNIKDGDFVKVSVNNERFWVIVTNVNGDVVTGTIDNDLLQKQLKYKDIIEFPKNCIYDIDNEF